MSAINVFILTAAAASVAVTHGLAILIPISDADDGYTIFG